MEKNIHFADTPICQSCGMPLTDPDLLARIKAEHARAVAEQE